MWAPQTPNPKRKHKSPKVQSLDLQCGAGLPLQGVRERSTGKVFGVPNLGRHILPQTKNQEWKS
jgi:hypothetical protein